MATSVRGEDPAYIVTTDMRTDPGYGFSLTRFKGEDVIQLMVEDQTHCPVGKADMTAILYRDRLVVAVAPGVVAGLDIPTDYVVTFSAPEELLREMDETMNAICAGIAEYSARL
jgi:hypothetical protein